MKYAVITGSTKGIGKAIAKKLLGEGWFVFANYAHDDESAEQFVAECRADFQSGGVALRSSKKSSPARRRCSAL